MVVGQVVTKELTRNKSEDARIISSPQAINPFSRFFVSALDTTLSRNIIAWVWKPTSYTTGIRPRLRFPAPSQIDRGTSLRSLLYPPLFFPVRGFRQIDRGRTGSCKRGIATIGHYKRLPSGSWPHCNREVF